LWRVASGPGADHKLMPLHGARIRRGERHVSHADDIESTVDPNRRDFLYIATAATGAVLGGAAIWPLIDQMNPARDVLALATVEVPVDGLEAGTQLTVKWRGKPVFIRKQTPEEIAEAADVPLSDLPDQLARNDNLGSDAPATVENRGLGENGEWLVQIGVCTHLGCVPIVDAGDYDGWFCPCHGSHYDTVGRIRKGPAPENLHIPVAEFVDENTIRLG